MKLTELKCFRKNVNIDKYIEFRESVKEKMKYPEWLGDFSKEDLLKMKDNNSIIWIYYLGNEPVCSMMLIPSVKQDLNKFEIDLNYKEVADYGPMFVNPKFVGNGLQYQMLKELDNYCIKLGYKYAIGTIHPDNIYSINNFIQDDFKLFAVKEFTRGTRNIYLKCINSDYIQKILSFVVKDDKYLLLEGNDNDPQFHKSFWYVVTGAVEKDDISLSQTVKREILEETGLKVLGIKRIPIIFQYESLGKKCIEHVFISEVEDENIILNEESINYRWCNINEFTNLIHWFYDKDQLKNIIEKYFI